MNQKHKHWRTAATVATSISLLMGMLGTSGTGCKDGAGGALTGGSAGSGPGGAGPGGGGGAAGGMIIGPQEAACVGDRWIGRAPGGNCPMEAPGWTVSRLFNPPPDNEPLLSQYCLYEWQNNMTDPTPATLPPLQNPMVPAQEWLDKDCAAVGSLGAGQSTANINLMAGPLWGAFTAQIDAPAGLTAPAQGPHVRIAVIDSWPSPATVGESHHGFGMAGIMNGLTCGRFAPGAVCPIETVPHLALNLLAPRVRDNVEGGYFGHFGRLAQEIYKATRSYQGALQMGDKLILNLSVGWDNAFNADSGGQLSDAVAAVHDVLVWAVCHGALVISAAGNTSGATAVPGQGIGPTFPAAWQVEAAPSCLPCGAAGTCPLVYSAGGVDGADLPLSNVRPEGRPPLAAPSFAVPGIKTVGGSPTPTVVGPFTGSSVSAASISAAAAMLWAYDGSLSSADVMSRLYTTGVDLGEPSNFCVLAMCPDVHRVSLCQALASLPAPELSGLVCSPPAPHAGLNPMVPPDLQDDVAMLVTGVTSAGDPADFDGTGLVDTIGACGDDILVKSGASLPTADPPCPIEELPTDLRNVAIDPQPGPDPCPACHAYISSSPDEVILELLIYEELKDSAFAEVLTLLRADGTVLTRYDLAEATGNAPLKAGEAYRIVLPRDPVLVDYPTTFRTAIIEWVGKSEETSKTSQLIVTVQ